MVSSIADLYQQAPWVSSDGEKPNNQISHSLHPCQYNEDLGADDSEPESQISDGSSISQDSYNGLSPAASNSSEESRADQQVNEPSDDHWSKPEVSATVVDGAPNNRVTHHMPIRLKPDSEPDRKASENALAAQVYAAQHESVYNTLNNALPQASQHPRRGRSTVAAGPPALRRDTDATTDIVKMIVVFCTNLINSIWCTNGQFTVAPTTSQPGANVLPLHIFITETLRRSKTSYSTLQIALYYLILLKQCLPTQTAADKSGCRAMQCGRRMFLTSLILASKYLQDRNYSARAWSKISGLPLKEINENERRFLSIVSWDLHVPKSTFENWSKIVLQVCRRSQDISTSCKGLESFSHGPGSGPVGSTTDSASNAVLHNRWWLVSLQQLKTDVVKCGHRTQRYVESLCPFRQSTPIYRSVSPDSDTSDDTVDNLADILVETPISSRQPSLDRSTKRFEPVPDLLHPAAPLAMPPQPMLKNLPTPLTTPQASVQNYWTPRLAHQSSSSSLRCRASASALGNAFRRHCPIANLETCPPPPPRTCAKTQSSTLTSWQIQSNTTSVVSSPESVVSDAWSFVGRSRSSSISSTGSWGNIPSQSSDCKWFVGNPPAVPSASRPGQPCAPRVEQQIERPQTAFKVPKSQSENEQVSRWHDASFTDLERIATKKNQEAAEILVGLRVDTSAVRSRCRPAMSRSGTQIYNPRQEQDSKNQQLKRSRSDTFEYTSSSSSAAREGDSTPTKSTTPRTQQCRNALDHCYKRVQQPTECWAQPRKPLQTGPRNKRLALQISPGNLTAAELAGHYLKPDALCELNRSGTVVH